MWHFQLLFSEPMYYPTNIKFLPPFVKKNTKTLDKIIIAQNQITALIRKVQAKKSHGHDGIPAKLLKMADYSVSHPLSI